MPRQWCKWEGCGSSFVSNDSLRRHENIPHSPCPFCGRNLSWRGMTIHKSRLHKNERFNSVKPGQEYRHFKGGRYKVLHVGRRMKNTGQNEQVGEIVVVYMAIYHHEIYGSNAVWVQSISSFLEIVQVGRRSVPRFDLVSSAPD
jgi:hypothetical protein